MKDLASAFESFWRGHQVWLGKGQGPHSRLWDPIRKKWVQSGPEEIVRYYVIQCLREVFGVPSFYIVVESSVRRLGGKGHSEHRGLMQVFRTFRVDVVVLNRRLEPALLVECKSPTRPLQLQVLWQAIQYLERIPSIRFVWLTNGVHHWMGERDVGHPRLWKPIPVIPEWKVWHEL